MDSNNAGRSLEQHLAGWGTSTASSSVGVRTERDGLVSSKQCFMMEPGDEKSLGSSSPLEDYVITGKAMAAAVINSSSCLSNSMRGCLDETCGGRKRCTQDSEDSSYDSDCEVSDATSHFDVSRTVSDTLGQEFAEYVTVGGTPDSGKGGNPTSCAEYSTRLLEFAKKLGYSEAQVQIALSKLGKHPSEDELLKELIQLDSLNPSSLVDLEADSKDNQDAGEDQAACSNNKSSTLRHIVIDGSNVAMSHGNNKVFSCRGIQLAVNFFRQRGHKEITVFVPSYRKESSKPDDPVIEQHILFELEKNGVLVYTPSRTLNNRRLICYDDRFILKLAVDVDGIVVSNDNYRDLTIESHDFKKIIEERILMYSFVNDRFMPPEDPLGRNGPTIDQFLSKAPVPSAPPCPYGRKCTYGQKCKYYHSKQQKSVSETLRKQAAMKTQSVPTTMSSLACALSGVHLVPVSRTKSAKVPLESSMCGVGSTVGSNTHKKLQRQLSINPGGDPRLGALAPTTTPVTKTVPPIGGSKSNPVLLSSSDPLVSSGNSSSSNSSSSSGVSSNKTYLHLFPGNPHLSEVWSPINVPSSHGSCVGRSISSNVGSGLSFAPEGNSKPSNCGVTSPLRNVDGRTKMYFHLSAIFPENQVQYVMNMYPEETDPGFICRAIINMFPK